MPSKETIVIWDVENVKRGLKIKKSFRKIESQLGVPCRHIACLKRDTPLTPFFHFLGMEIIDKKAKKVETKDHVYHECDMDGEITHLLHEAFNDGYNRIVLISGDGDFYAVLKKLKDKGAEVLIASPSKSKSRRLKRSFDNLEVVEKGDYNG